MGLAAIILLIYVVSRTTFLTLEGSMMLDAIVIASAIAIFGDKFNKYRK